MTQTTNTQTLQWGSHQLLGHAQMDDIHEEFVELASQLEQANDADLPDLLLAMEQHLQQHFSQENTWMEQSSFPPRQCHIDEHAAVLKSVAEVREKLATGDVAICRSLIQALVDWFPGHATHLDSALAHWLSKQRFGGKPVVLRRGVANSL